MSKRHWYISLFLSNSNVQHYLVVGEWLQFGSDEYSNWDAVLEYLSSSK
ncbi:hypothetical protein N9P66_01275 [Salibacteraceae bacterium]|nr:hypothetical protein [Salibacteraceae bacterium]